MTEQKGAAGAEMDQDYLDMLAAMGEDPNTMSAEEEADAIAAAAPDSARSGLNRVLSQEEIDNLLGFTDEASARTARTGVQAIIDNQMVSYERLPMLEVVFDRLVRLTTASLRSFTGDTVEVTIDNISSVRFGEYMDAVPLPAVLTIFKAVEWDNYGLINVSGDLIYALVDVLLGGKRGVSVPRMDGRPYTTIEMTLVSRMTALVLADMTKAFAPLTDVQFEIDRNESNPRFAAITRNANAAVLIEFKIDMESRGGRLEMLLPYTTIEPIREQLLQVFMGETFGRDNDWERHLATQVALSELDVEAVLATKAMALRDVMAMDVGDTLMLDVTPDDLIEMRAGGIRLGQAQMGRAGEKIAVRAAQPLRRRPARAIQDG